MRPTVSFHLSLLTDSRSGPCVEAVPFGAGSSPAMVLIQCAYIRTYQNSGVRKTLTQLLSTQTLVRHIESQPLLPRHPRSLPLEPPHLPDSDPQPKQSVRVPGWPASVQSSLAIPSPSSCTQPPSSRQLSSRHPAPSRDRHPPTPTHSQPLPR